MKELCQLAVKKFVSELIANDYLVKSLWWLAMSKNRDWPQCCGSSHLAQGSKHKPWPWYIHLYCRTQWLALNLSCESAPIHGDMFMLSFCWGNLTEMRAFVAWGSWSMKMISYAARESLLHHCICTHHLLLYDIVWLCAVCCRCKSNVGIQHRDIRCYWHLRFRGVFFKQKKVTHTYTCALICCPRANLLPDDLPLAVDSHIHQLLLIPRIQRSG